MAACNVCFRRCEIPEGGLGFCLARTNAGGVVRPASYGKITALALDPIEKKPLMRFYPGSKILSVGSYGCNLRCPFCQNHEISWSAQTRTFAESAEELRPEALVDLALGCRDRGNIGLAFTYNEPLTGWEFVRDTAEAAKAAGLKTVLVTNGTAALPVLEALGPHIDAMNIDLKGFSRRYYREVLGGDLDMTLAFIRRASALCHVELTTLIVPGENDSPEEMRRLAAWVAELNPEIPLHVSRFFPRFHMTDRPPTPVRQVRALAAVAGERLKYVCLGNC